MVFRYINKKDLNEYELKYKKLSYKNLFYNDDNLILCNNINYDDKLTLKSGTTYNETTGESTEIYQYYIISDNLAERLMEIDELVFYHEELDLYVLGVTHFGTGWNYVLTDLKLVEDENDKDYYIVKYEKEEE